MSAGQGRDHPLALLFVFLLVVGLLVGAAYAMLTYWLPPTPTNITMVVSGIIAYLVICYLVNPPEFDPDELGWCPFSYRDDWNRGLLYLNLLMLPGIALSITVVQLVYEIRRRIG